MKVRWLVWLPWVARQPIFVLLLALAAGCAGSGAPIAPEVPRAGPEGAPQHVAQEELGWQFYPGEHFEADIFAYGFTVGELEINVEPPCAAEGGAILPVRSVGRSAGLVGAIKPTLSELASWLDPHAGLPLYTRAWIDEESKHVEAQIDFEESHVHSLLQTNDEKPKERRVPLPADGPMHDMHSMLGALRSLAAAPAGTTARMYMASARVLWQLEVRVGARESLSAGGEPVATVRVGGTALKTRDGRRTYGKPAEWAVWISDDAERLPVRAELEVKGRRLRLELVGYERRPFPREMRPCG